jgi:glyoxylase-like metal-dependent hydrolase (beta-lactamase superfamily II)
MISPVRGLCAALLVTATLTGTAAAIPPRSVAPGVGVLLGSFVEGTQPDGNTVIFTAPDGLVVMDTGRHAEHTQQILDFAQRVQQPIKAVINSHWHLDHIGGISRIRDAYPQVRIYASGAIEGALSGFLADYRRDLEGALQRMPGDPQAAGWRDELAIIAAAPRSIPDERITRSGVQLIAGRKLDLHLETAAATAGDIWVLDSPSHVLAAGDLVTLPVPFLDTACPRGWQSALNNISHAQFKTLIPGHGPPMPRERFENYRHAFGNLLSCAADHTRANGDCVDGWISDAGTLIAEADQSRARKMMDYYMVNSLRGKPERIEKLCASSVS